MEKNDNLSGIKISIIKSQNLEVESRYESYLSIIK